MSYQRILLDEKDEVLPRMIDEPDLLYERSS